MARRTGLVLLLCVSLVALPACSSWSRQEQGMALGAIGGAGLGALIGAASGSWAWGAVIGAAGGALAGYVIADATAPRAGWAPTSEGDKESTFKRSQADEYLRKANAARTSADSEYYLKKSIDAYPSAAACNNLGLIYKQRGEDARAEAMWRKALELEPAYRPAKDNLARSGKG